MRFCFCIEICKLCIHIYLYLYVSMSAPSFDGLIDFRPSIWLGRYRFCSSLILNMQMISFTSYGRHTSLLLGYCYLSYILKAMKYVLATQQIYSTLEYYGFLFALCSLINTLYSNSSSNIWNFCFGNYKAKVQLYKYFSTGFLWKCMTNH
jgi:hypothetical protein